MAVCGGGCCKREKPGGSLKAYGQKVGIFEQTMSIDDWSHRFFFGDVFPAGVGGEFIKLEPVKPLRSFEPRQKLTFGPLKLQFLSEIHHCQGLVLH